MSTQIVSLKEKVTSIRALLERAKPQIALALPKHLSADRLIRVALTSVQRTPDLLDCDQTSLLAAIIQSAQLGLEPDGVLGHAYLVPFRNTQKQRREVQFIPGYKGLVALARRSGEVSSLDARVVRAGDHFRYAFGLTPVLEHVPADHDADEAPAITHAYAVVRLKDGGYQFEVMTHREIETVRKRSRAGQSGPWVSDWPEMAKKTVLRRALKLAPMSIEAQRAVALDELAEAGVSQALEVVDVGPAAAETLGLPPAHPGDTPEETTEGAR
jgi:recombination protein RecT